MKKFMMIFLLSVVFTTVKSQNTYEKPEHLIKALYQEVTLAPGESPDWEFAKSMFLEEAVIVLRYGPDDLTVFDVQGWVDDFVTFIREDGVSQTGFEEHILGMHTYVYGDIASINVLFESHIRGTDRRNKGVDIFQLIKKNDRWMIVSIVNERPLYGGPVPEIYQTSR